MLLFFLKVKEFPLNHRKGLQTFPRSQSALLREWSIDLPDGRELKKEIQGNPNLTFYFLTF